MTGAVGEAEIAGISKDLAPPGEVDVVVIGVAVAGNEVAGSLTAIAERGRTSSSKHGSRGA